jgi:hypothetical protein
MAAAAPLAVAHDLHPMLHHFETVGPGKIVFGQKPIQSFRCTEDR